MARTCTSCGVPLPARGSPTCPAARASARPLRRGRSDCRCRDEQPPRPQARHCAVAIFSALLLAVLVVGLIFCLSGDGGTKEKTLPISEKRATARRESHRGRRRKRGFCRSRRQPDPSGQKERKSEPRLVAFMDSVATGRRFCIIADSSNSMKGYPFDRCKQEVLKTLKSLTPDSQFYVIFFNMGGSMPHPTWLEGGKENVDKVTPWVEKATLALGTRPTPAFRKAFQLQPRPDVIFFLTDGKIPAKAPDDIAAMNNQSPCVVINTILFNRGLKAAATGKGVLAESQLRCIAKEFRRHLPPLHPRQLTLAASVMERAGTSSR